MATHAGKPRLDPAALHEPTRSAEGPRLLDGRTPGEYRTAHIPGSQRPPRHPARAPRRTAPHLDEDVILVCRSVPRDAQAGQALAEAGLPDLQMAGRLAVGETEDRRGHADIRTAGPGGRPGTQV
ncbi:rhodanese-like domain-containing protein [Streptomyces sp. NPDC001410]|uniref:rhodanese-like domain-containing protein n=1 Tax=Streptomyces sp. NPDC001410 TaxID=3364574 RepID=UPI0036958E0B